MRILVTGASGFVGRALMRLLSTTAHEAVPVTRAELDDDDRLAAALAGSDVVVHLAALAHRSGRGGPSAAEFDAVNHRLPVRVYRAATVARVPRMLHVSTINVVTGNRGKLAADSPVTPTTPYDVAKAAAEADLTALSMLGGPELGIVRPPLVYGPGVRGNMALLTRLARTPLLLPFASVANARSFLGVSNLAAALLFLAEYPKALPPPALFHVADDRDLSLSQLLTAIRSGLGRAPGLVPFPPRLIRLALALLGRGRMAGQLLDDLSVDDEPLRALGWRPPYPAKHDLAAMVRDRPPEARALAGKSTDRG